MTHPSTDGRVACLREMLNEQIEREGPQSSFIIRAGLLREILQKLAAVPRG